MAVSKKKRFEVFKRDKFRCLYCGRTPPQVVLEADHVVPRAEGGPDTMDNLATSCFDCNRGKSDGSLSNASAPLADVMADAVERREQMEAYQRFLMKQRAEEDKRIKQVGLYWYDSDLPSGHPDMGRYVFGPARQQTAREFLRRLPLAEVLEAVDITRRWRHASNDEKNWRYFCGVCWNKIHARG